MRNYNEYWKDPELTKQQKAKCLLLGIRIFQSRTTGGLIISRNGGRAGDYVRGVGPNGALHVEVKTFKECIEMFADPAKFGGRWG